MTDNSSVANPVTLPPGRARLLINPASTGEEEPGMMIGTVRVNCIRTGITRPPMATITSGFNTTRLAALARTRSILSPKRLGGPEVDDQLELGRPQYRKTGRAFAFQDAAGVTAELPISLRQLRAVAHQSAGDRELTKFIDRGDGLA